MTEEEDRIRALFLHIAEIYDWDLRPSGLDGSYLNVEVDALWHKFQEFARSEREARQPKIYKAPETPKVCEECDSTCFVTAGGQDLVCYHCLLVSKAESERDAGRREVLEDVECLLPISRIGESAHYYRYRAVEALRALADKEGS